MRIMRRCLACERASFPALLLLLLLPRHPEPTRTSLHHGCCDHSDSEYVRFAPWFPYPRVVVTELEPPDCTATKPATNWCAESGCLSPALATRFLCAETIGSPI